MHFVCVWHVKGTGDWAMSSANTLECIGSSSLTGTAYAVRENAEHKISWLARGVCLVNNREVRTLPAIHHTSKREAKHLLIYHYTVVEDISADPGRGFCDFPQSMNRPKNTSLIDLLVYPLARLCSRCVRAWYIKREIKSVHSPEAFSRTTATVRSTTYVPHLCTHSEMRTAAQVTRTWSANTSIRRT